MKYCIYLYILVNLMTLNALAEESGNANKIIVDVLDKKEVKTKCGCYYEKKSMKESIVVYWVFDFKKHHDEKAIIKINNKLETLNRKPDKFDTFENSRYSLSVETQVVHLNNYETSSCQDKALEEGSITVSDKTQSITMPIIGSCGC